MIREFETSPEAAAVRGGPIRWNGKISVDLRWVASAAPWGGDEEAATQISLCGDSWRLVVHCLYHEFMVLWKEARGG